MQLFFEPTRLTGLAILAVASATALSAGACSSSHDDKSSTKSSSAAPSPAGPQGKNQDKVQGQVESVSGNAVHVTDNGGGATIDVGPSAKVTEYAKAQLSDVAVGNCVTVLSKPAPPPAAPSAGAVQLNPPQGDGKCPQPKPAAAGTPGAPGPDKLPPAVGTVATVEGNNIKVSVTDANGNPSQTEVTVSDKTQYTKGVPADLRAVTQGKCITARGNKDSGGTLQAAFVTLTPANAQGHC